MGETALKCSHDRLSTVIHTQSLQNRTHVTLYSRFGDAENAGDLLVAVSTNHEMQHFPFPGTQFGIWYARGQRTRDRWRQEAAAAVHSKDRIDQCLIRHSFDDIALCAGFESAVDVFIAIIGGDDDETSMRFDRADRGNRVDSAHLSGEPQVHQRDVGLVLAIETNRFFSTPTLGYYSHVFPRIDDGSNAHTHERMIVDHHHTYFFSRVHRLISEIGVASAVLRGTAIVI